MDDRNQEVFRKYDIKVYTTYKARGAIVLETDRGLVLLKNCEGSTARVEFENVVKEYLIQQGYFNVDLYLRNLDGELITEDSCGNKYVLKNWFVGEECNLKSTEDVMKATANLAILHSMLSNVPISPEVKEKNLQGNLYGVFEKRNRELKRVRTYIKDKRQKNEFEMCYISNYERFYQQGLQALEELVDSGYEQLYNEAMRLCAISHGNYTYHNVMMLRGNQPACAYETRNRKGMKADMATLFPEGSLTAADISTRFQTTASTNFDKSAIGIQCVDLYHFLRKVMEKNDWDVDYGSMILEEYNRVKPLSAQELKVLYVLLLYPEKFWKITNFYYNSKKSWVPQRNIQKLVSLQEQHESKERFLKSLKAMC